MPRNLNAERDNPCLKEQELSYKCLSNNNYEKDPCELYFTNYNNCKEFWVQFPQQINNRIRAERRSKRIKPYLPPVEERDAIKEQHKIHQHGEL